MTRSRLRRPDAALSSPGNDPSTPGAPVVEAPVAPLLNGTGRGLTAADVFLFAPLGLAIRAGQLLPGALQSGRAEYAKRAATAQMLGKFIVAQQRRNRSNTSNTAIAAFATAAARSGKHSGEATGDAAPQTLPGRTQPVASNRASQLATDPSLVNDARSELPIDGYDTLPARSLLALFDGLSADQLETIRCHELANRRRETVLSRLSQLQQATAVAPQDG